MPEYAMVISVEGRDRASGALGGVNSMLQRMLGIAGGIVGSRIILGIADQVGNLAQSAFNAAAQFQFMQVGLEGLVARGLVELSGGVKTVAEVFPEAQKGAAALMDELSRIAILSPYTVEMVQNTFRLNMAFGFTADQARNVTDALLNMAAGIGASNDMLQRMAYNFAQIRTQGKVTALDVRQLAQAGMDLEGVLRFVSKEMGYTIKDHNDFNKLLKEGKINWTDFTESFKKYAETNFAGAANRMARTIMGLKSTFHDLFVLTIPKMILPALNEVTTLISRLLDAFIRIRESGVLEAIGLKWQEAVRKLLAPFNEAFDLLENYYKLVGELKTIDLDDEAYGTLAKAIAKLVPQGDLLAAMFKKIWGFRGVEVLGSIRRGLQLTGMVFKWLHGVVSVAFKGIGILLDGFKKFWDQNGESLSNYIWHIVTSLAGLGSGQVANAGNIFLSVMQKIADWFVEYGPRITSFIGRLALWIDTTLIPAVDRAGVFIRDRLIPAFIEIVAWLREHIPLAIEKVKTFFDTKLLPPFQRFIAWVNATWPVVWKFFETKLLPPFQKFIAWLKANWPGIWELIKDVMVRVVIPALTRTARFIISTVIPAFQKFVEWATTHKETFVKIAGAIVGALTAFSIVKSLMGGALPIVGMLVKAFVYLVPAITAAGGILAFLGETLASIGSIVAVVGGFILPIFAGIAIAVGLLVAAWVTNFGGIRDFTAQAWAIMQPVFAQLWSNIVMIAQAVGGFLASAWSNVLLPAIMGVGDFLRTVIFPVLLILIQFIANVLTAALTIGAAAWNNIFLPALKAIWDFLNAYIFPIIGTVAGIIKDIFVIAVNLVRIAWELLQPKLEAAWKLLGLIWDVVAEKLKPAFDVLKMVWDMLVDAVKTAVEGPLEKLKSAFAFINGLLSAFKDWLDKIIDLLGKVKVPGSITKHSPSPMERGFMAVNDQMALMADKSIPRLMDQMKRLKSLSTPSVGLNPGMYARSANAGVMGANGGSYVTIPVHIDQVGSNIDVESLFFQIATRLRSRGYG